MTHSGHSDNQQAWDSEFDSTFEDEEEDKQPKTDKAAYQYTSQRRAAQDLQNYRHGYPDTSPKLNLLFYQNKIPFKPNGEYIDKIHKCWHNDYDTLEHNHNFIQWLFPLQERGVNHCATPLTESEIQLMKSDEEVMKRLLESYKLMLGFYGIVLLDPDTGKVARAKENWKNRFKNLNNNTHNNLRITRILKCLGEMGYERFQAPLVRFFLTETLCNGQLQSVKQSALDYFMFTVKDKKQRRSLVHFAWVHYKPQNRFIWGPVEKLQKFNPPPEDAEQDGEVDTLEELNIPSIPSTNDSSGGYYVEDSEVARREPENKRERGLVRRTVGYVCRNFLLFRLFMSFLEFFTSLRPIRYLGGILWFRGEAGNEDQISAKTEGANTEKTMAADMATVNMSVNYKGRSQGFTKSEHERLLKDPERQKRHKTELKELNVSADVKTDNCMNESKMEAKLETEGNGSKCESISENGTGSADKKALVNIEMPENGQAKEDDNHTENEDDSRNFTKGKNVIKLAEGQISENDRLEGAEEGSVKENNEAKGSETYNHGGGREHNGKHIANAGNQTEEEKKYNGNSEHEDASKVKLVPLFSGEGDDAEKAKIIITIEDHRETSTTWSGDNDGGNIETQNTLPQTDKTDQVERDIHETEVEEADNVKLSPQVGDEDENLGVSKIEDSRGTLVLGSGDNDGGNNGAQNTLLETDKSEQADRYGKTKDEEAAIVKLSPQIVEEGDEDKNPGTNNVEDKRGTLVLGSVDNDGGNTGAQNTLPEIDKTNQFEIDDGKTMDEEAANVKLSPHSGKEEDEDEDPRINKIEDNRESLVLGSGDNDGGNIGAQNTLPETDNTDQVDRDDGKTKYEEAANVKLSPQFGEGGEDKNLGINKIEDNRRTLVLGSGDSDGGKIGAQNTLPETDKTNQFERDDGDTKDDEAANVKLSPHLGEKGDEDENPGINKIEDNRGALVLGSGDNDEENIESQIIKPNA
ncbi:uncharacterized protein LOC143936030 isoform X2 [Lithobates pipiens]